MSESELARAEREAAALLAELKAKDEANATAASVHKMPSPYAPGEGPRNPANSVAQPGGESQLNDALNSTFRPVDPDTISKPTNTSSHSINWADKIKAAQAHHGRH